VEFSINAHDSLASSSIYEHYHYEAGHGKGKSERARNLPERGALRNISAVFDVMLL
jgi:hypothetical protein